MGRPARQSKILEIIQLNEIETQEELVALLKRANFNVTQATISRDIKELSLIKILSPDTGKYKYAVIENNEQAISNKYISIFKEAVISINQIDNFCIIKTLKIMASAVCEIIDKFHLENVICCVSGNDTVLIILPDEKSAKMTLSTLNSMVI